MLKRIFILIGILLSANSSSSDQLMWVEQVSGTTQTLTSVHSDHSTNVWVCGYGGTVLRSTNTGLNWINVSGNGIPINMQLINIFTIAPSIAITAGYVGSNTFVFRTTNSGANWTQVFTQTNGFINAICFKVFEPNGFMMGDPVGGRWSLWKTTDGGINWDSSGLYLPQIGAEAGWVNSMFCTENRIWFGTSNLKVYYSTNFGSTWIPQSTSGEINSYAIWFCRFPLSGGNRGFMGGTTLETTTNSGMEWFSQTASGTGNFGGISGGPNLITDNNAGYLYQCYVRSSNVIYSTTNFGTNWTAEYTAPSGTYRYVASDYAGRDFWAVRTNGGISYLDLPVGITQISSEVPKDYSLGQNYPNPFNPKTIINYEIPSNVSRQTSDVNLVIYNSSGQEILTLVNEKQSAGSYKVEFNGSNLPSGVYFYKLISGEFVETKTMVLIK